nr:uncharacterized protein LOC123769218 [Procambarus clarkii]
MLKWTLKNATDAPTPPPPDVRYEVQAAEVNLNLKDSNTCWLETQVKVAQVRATSKVVENGNVYDRLNGNADQRNADQRNADQRKVNQGNADQRKMSHRNVEQGKENDSIFKRWMSSSHTHAEEEKKRKRQHKHTSPLSVALLGSPTNVGRPARPTTSVGRTASPTTSIDRLARPTTSVGGPASPTTSMGRTASPTTSMGRTASPTTSMGRTASPTTSMGRTASPTTSVGRPARPTTSVGRLASPATSVGRPARPTTSIDRLASSTTSVGRLAGSTTSVGRLAGSTTSVGRLAGSTTSVGRLASPTTSVGRLASPTTSMGRLARSTTSLCRLASSTTSLGRLSRPTTSMGRLASSTTCVGRLASSTTCVGRLASPTTRVGRLASPATSVGRLASPATSVGRPASPTTSVGRLASPATSVGRLASPATSVGRLASPATSVGRLASLATSVGRLASPATSVGRLASPTTSVGRLASPATSVGRLASPTTSVGRPASPATSVGRLASPATSVGRTASPTTSVGRTASPATSIDRLASSTTSVGRLAGSTTSVGRLASSTTSMGRLASSTTSMGRLASSTTCVGRLASSTTCVGRLASPATSVGRLASPATSVGRLASPATSVGRLASLATSVGRLASPATSVGRPASPTTSVGRPASPTTSVGRPASPTTSVGRLGGDINYSITFQCNALDPLRLFSGEVTDSDTGSVYMRLDHTPAALLPRPQVLATTGPSDPRRKPLVDLSNGDYSDLRKHLQDISASHRHHRHHHHPRARLPEYLQQFAPSHYLHHHHDTGLQSTVGGAGSCRLEPLGASASQADLKLDCRRHSRSSSRSRSSSASRSRPLAAENSSLLANTTVTSCSSSSRGAAEGQSQSMLQEGRGGRAPHAFKRHSIADVPTEASFRGVWETQKERRGRSCSRERGESSRNKSILSRLSRDKRKESRVEEREERSGRGREGRRASRERSREEPIYEKVGNGDTSSANTTSSSVSSKRSKATSGSSINSRKSLNSYDNAIYMSMRDLRAQCQQPKTERCVYEVEHLYSPLHPRISPDLSQTRVHTREHLYENMLYLPMTDVKSSTKKPQDRSRPLPEPPSFDHHDLDDTCDFTSEPQKDIHKPVAIKISNDLIARFGKSPNERQHPMPHYGLYIASQPSKMPCTGEGGKDSDPHKVVSDGSRGKVYRSTGQHVHINYSQGPCEPSVALHSLRPPPPPPPRQSKTSQYNNSSKTRHKPKGQPKPKSDSHLPIIYENTRQEEDLSQSAKKRKLRHTMEIEFSFDDEDIPINRCSGNRCVSETSSRGGNISSSDNPDSGVSEGITTPLISPLSAPRSPETARSDSLLEESYTPLSLEELHPFRENGGLTLARENGDMSRNSTILSVSHDITDPRFLESFLRDKPHLRKKYEGQSSIITEASVDDFFNYTNTLSLQQTSLNISFSNLDNLYQNYVDCIETSRNNRNNDVSKLLLCAVGRNLFSESSHKVSTPNRDSSQHTNSISRRHSFAGVADISRRLSNIGFSDDTSLWGMDVSSNSESTLKRSKSLHCLSPSLVSQESSDVPLMDSMARILENPELWLHPCDYSVLLANGEQITGEQSEQWWEGREEEEEEGGRWATSGSGGVGVGRRGQPAHTGSLALSPASHHHLRQPIPAPHSPTLLLLPPTCNPTPALPVEMNGGKHVAAGHAGACHSVPLRSPSCEDTPQLDSSPCGSECCADLTVLPGACDLTARQRRRQEESTFRLQHMLRDCAQPLRANDSEDSVSADWSMEAVLNEVSTIDHQDLDAEISDPLDFPDSPDCQDVISLCTLDSDYADSIFISPKLCQKIQQVSEEKMLARLRKSFRGKKDKRSGNEVDKPKTTAPAKVGILMFVDNPMYLSPEVKKEAKIVSAQNNENSVWYVGNPMYNSPEPNKLRNVNYDIRQKVLCEKENLRNSRLAKVVCQSATNRKPLSSIWHQSNPCYESPDTKKLEVKLSNLKASSGNLDDTYLTPIPVKHPKNFVPRPTVVVPASLAADKDILDAQKFLDHEYCTIPGDESDSWVSQSTTSRRSESPSARRSLEFGANQSKTRGTRPLNTPSRMWRQTAKNQHSTPRKYQGTLEKNLNSGAPLGTRGLKTPRTVKRGKKSKDICQEEVRSSSSPPPLPARPHPLHRHYENDRSTSTVGFEDTNDFHHRGDLQDLHRRGLKDLDDTGEFQLPPDSMYESINSHQARGSCGLARSVSHASGYSRRLRQVLHPSGSSSVCSSPVPSSSRASRSRCSFSGTKNLLGGSLGEGSLKGRSRRTSTTKRVSKKYRARDVLQSKAVSSAASCRRI